MNAIPKCGTSCKKHNNYNGKIVSGAPRETRTPDPLITNQVLYQLSYKGN